MQYDQKSNAHPLVYVLVVLVALNLALTAGLFFRNPVAVPGVKNSSIAQLPEYLTDTEIDKLKNWVISLYNARDIDAFYSEFDELVKVQLSQDQVSKTITKLYELAGVIENAAYVNYSDLSSQGQPGTYALNFQVRVGESDFSTGSMTITVIDRGDWYGLLGFYLNPRITADSQ